MINIKKIQELRGGLSPYQFAKLVGLDARTILTMEKGESVTLSTLKKIADKFNLKMKDLVQ